MADQPQMWLRAVVGRKVLAPYPFGPGTMAVNLFFASLIWFSIGWPVPTSLPTGAVPVAGHLGLCPPYPTV
jgi:hypothetical protein